MLDGIPLSTLTPSFLLGLAVLMVFLGWIVPKRTLTRADEEAARWRKAYEAEREARATSDAQTVELLEVAKSSHDFLAAMYGTAQQIRLSGATHVAQEE